MANRRCIQNLNRHFQFLRTRTPHLNPQFLAPTSKFTLHPAFTPKSLHRLFNSNDINAQSVVFRHFCSKNRNDDTDEEEEDEDDDDDYESEGQDIESADDERENETAALSPEDKEKEAAEIGYKVISPLQKSDRVFKPYEPVFAVVQIGSHQFKVSNGDCIYAEKLKYCNVNDKLILNKVLMLGSKTQTIIGRPILPDAAVHAVVEEHALDAKVIIFKKKRRKNYRRTKGHRQELTKLRITDISGIEKPENMPSLKTEKKEKIPSLKTEKKEKQEKMPVAA
ncbi:50S ribosomal protein L21, mitochondrial-like [Olea europaea var. sylvestris]|uniref:50S ribosomal protein L21, mitochondrial-like n=1 Tax=Olea europaea var. sylvestris TaxID=158386 RepID=UPI000C1D23DE|nr:50S ribosomal protein L21, mitochondrial-like [Olea europaea var. sylvestris]